MTSSWRLLAAISTTKGDIASSHPSCPPYPTMKGNDWLISSLLSVRDGLLLLRLRSTFPTRRHHLLLLLLPPQNTSSFHRLCSLPTNFTTTLAAASLTNMYGSLNDVANRQHSHLIERAILAPRNKDVDALNAHAVASFPGEEFVYSSADRVADKTQAHMFPPEYLHTINPPGFAPHELRLKVGIPIILLRNVSPALGLANGTRLVTMHLSRSVTQAKILMGSHVGNVVCIPRINMNTNADDKTIPVGANFRSGLLSP